ncbi:AaceriAER106Cp [[Ashbya] aceris (nom. inval.)]|nr:AaceriAER106Cp [[Ashbya] aceris (nom. inval.)]
MSNTTQVKGFNFNAQRHLSRAQILCQNSQDTLHNMQLLLVRWQRTVSKLQFTIRCISNQTVFLAECILKKTVGEKLIDTEWKRMVLDELQNEMHRSQKEITGKIDTLRRTKNELDGTGATLADFISMENISLLGEKLRDVPVVQEQVEHIKVQYESLVDKVVEQLQNNRVRKLEVEFSTAFRSGKNDFNAFCMKHLQKIRQLETDLADILKSLTDHYDKCLLLKAGDLPAAEQLELFEVVKNDDQELESIMGVLEVIVKDIKSLAKNVSIKLRQKEKDRQQLKNGMGKALSELLKYEEHLTVFQGIDDLIRNFKVSCLHNVSKVRELCEFYDNFLNSYQVLLREVERRRKVARQMQDILQECEGKLSELSDTDLKLRQQFLIRHGDYLPENIWPGNIDDLSPLYKLEYRIKKV